MRSMFLRLVGGTGRVFLGVATSAEYHAADASVLYEVLSLLAVVLRKRCGSCGARPGRSMHAVRDRYSGRYSVGRHASGLRGPHILCLVGRTCDNRWAWNRPTSGTVSTDRHAQRV
jgi:hypothetical protein